MKVGDYVRTKYGYIRKIINEKYDDIYETDYYEQVLYPEDIKGTPSSNIIDLIGVGDIITLKNFNGIYRVCDKNDGKIELDYQDELGAIIINNDSDIKSIVTKEQFKSMEYKIKEEK